MKQFKLNVVNSENRNPLPLLCALVSLLTGFLLFTGCSVKFNSPKTTNESSTTAALSLGTSSQVNMNVNSEYTFSASGGTSPYTYSIVSGPTLGGSGSIGSSSGVYFSPSNSGTVVVKVTDSKGDSKNVTVNVGGNAMYVMGGFTGVVQLDNVYKSTDGINWSSVGNLPAPIMGHNSIVFKDKIWVLGGATGGVTRDVSYSSDGISWTTVTNALPAARAYGAVVVYNSMLWYLAGSSNGAAAGAQDTVYYSADGITWSTGSPISAKRLWHQAVVFNGKIYYMGGTNEASASQTSVRYSTNGSTWTEAGSLSVARTAFSATVFNEKVWIAGGNATNTIHYSSDMASWTNSGATLPANRWSAPDLQAFNGIMFMIGGSAAGPSYLNTSVSSNSDGTAWALQAGTLPSSMTTHTAVTFRPL